jgi:nardilysin
MRIKSLLANDDNTFSKMFYQIGPNSLRVGSLSRLLEAILNPKAYDFLRSKEQLGYSVACGLEKRGGIIGLTVYVLSQEHKHLYSTVLAKMETFMGEVARKAIEELTDEDFESYKDARIKTLLAEDLALGTEVGQNWPEIKEQDYVFDRSEMAAKKTRSLTKADLQDFFKSFTQPDNMRRLTTQVIGNQAGEGSETAAKNPNLNVEFINEKLNESENVIMSIEKFRGNLFLYPVVRFEI